VRKKNRFSRTFMLIIDFIAAGWFGAAAANDQKAARIQNDALRLGGGLNIHESGY
jgi:hypothetical protein